MARYNRAYAVFDRAEMFNPALLIQRAGACLSFIPAGRPVAFCKLNRHYHGGTRTSR